ncbi:MAG: FtsK/SpoIIIE domain-containing protein [Actinomycetota bacterium]|nr:FtsK/SpoIIIE domain-containing protein [Actinomycetota bacterium]
MELDDRPVTASWVCTWTTGPDAGASHDLRVGRHLMGRAHTATVRCDDPGLQPHHALLEVGHDGTLTLTQLSGRTPIVLSPPCTGATRAGEMVSIVDGTVVEIGGSTAVFSRSMSPAVSHGAEAHVHDGALVRRPRAVPRWVAPTLEAPAAPATPDSGGGSLVPAALGLAGTGTMALILQQPMFLLFGVLGGVVAVGSWVAQRLTARRRRRREHAAFAQLAAAHAAALERALAGHREYWRMSVPTIATAHRTSVARSAALWERRSDHPDAHTVSIGTGDLALPEPFTSDITDTVNHDHGPVATHLGPGARIAVCGPHAAAVARALLVQAATSCGPADLRIVVVTDRPAAWDCVRALPHLQTPGDAAVVTEPELHDVLTELAGHDTPVVLVTDQSTALSTRTGPLRRAIADPQRHALLVVLADEGPVPHLCTSVLTTTRGPLARWVPDARSTLLPVSVRFAGLGERAAFACAAAQRGLVDPEDPLAAASAVPRDVALTTLLAGDHGDGVSAAGIVARWAAAGCDPAPRSPIGVAADGVVDIDLVRDGPHGLIAGTTGAGKSELLRSLVAGMAATTSPAQLSFVLVDYKGGATFDACAALPHVVGVITDLDDRLADRALRSLHAELRRREALLRDHGVADLADLRAAAPHVVLPRLVVVIDEFAALVAEQPAFLHALVGVAQRGRSLGVHLLLATQRPNGVISDDIRANTNLRLALRLHDTADALDVVGIAAPAQLSRTLPGRAVMRLGADDHVTFQTARCTGGDDLAALVRAVVEAAALTGAPRPPAPWMPALPAVLEADQIAGGSVGLLDDPDHQRRTDLCWHATDGHLLVVGSPGSGATSTVCTLAAHVMDVEHAHVYVLDGRGGHQLDSLGTHPRCGAVVRLHERERVMRLLHRLARSGGQSTDASPVVLFIDGLDAVRRALDDVDTADEFDMLDDVLANGSARGVTVVATVEHASAVPAAWMVRCPHRWVLHLHEAHDAGLVGVPAARVPGGGTPGRIVDAATGLEGQLVRPVHPALLASTDDAEHAAPLIAALPPLVTATTLPRGSRRDGSTAVPVGLDFVTGDPASLLLPDGEHLVVVGGARTGRSSALARVANGWAEAHPGGWIGAVLPRRSSTIGRRVRPATCIDGSAVGQLLDELPVAGAALLLIDDADTVDDPDGRLAVIAAGGRPGTSLVIAGRPDALRQLYGHWTGVVRRSRMGVVLTGGSELDGDLLSAVVPRRTPVPARPGLAWLVDNGTVRLVQLAVDDERASRDTDRLPPNEAAH